MQLSKRLKTTSLLQFQILAFTQFLVELEVTLIVACSFGDSIGEILGLITVALLVCLLVYDLHLLLTSFDEFLLIHVREYLLATLRLQHHLFCLLLQLRDLGVDLIVLDFLGAMRVRLLCLAGTGNRFRFLHDNLRQSVIAVH